MPKTILHYRPQRTSPEILEAIFVAREHLLQEILNRLAQWRPGASRQHYLLIGPRGIGKTHVLILISHRILSTPSLNKTWVPVIFPEESYSVTRISDLLLEALRILSEETGDKETTAVYQQVRYDDNDARVTDLVLDALRKFHKSRGKGLIFLIENINRILERQIKDKAQVHLLRKILTEEDWLVTVCTSPTYLDAVTKEDQPLFEFFKARFLAELSQQEQLEMLEKLAAYEDNKDFQAYLQEYRSRLQALYHFTGGNPRLTIMLYDLISYQVISDVQAELDRLLDKITPFYQDRMKDINEQEGKLVGTMALLAEGCTPTELARESRMEAKTVRTVLGRLEKAGYVRREQRREKKTIYIIPERLFRIWHQMNHSRAGRGLIRYLLEFFSTWYQTKEQRDKAWKEIIEKLEKAADGEEELNNDLSEYMNYIIAVSEEGERFEREFDRIRNLILPKGKAAVEDELKQLDTRYVEEGNYFLHKGNFYAKDLHEPKSALSAYQKSCQLIPGDAVPLFNQAMMLEILKRPIEAKVIYKSAFNIITERTVPMDSLETLHALLDILRNGKSIYAVSIAATALGIIGSEKAVEPLIEALSDYASDARGSAATALGIIGSEKAVEPLIRALNDAANDVRGSAATALGRIGSEKSVEPLIKALSDKAQDARNSASMALTRIAVEKQISNLDKVIEKIFEHLKEVKQEIVYSVTRNLLKAAFGSADLKAISNALESARRYLNLDKFFYIPYEIAFEYLRSEREPAIMERQHPEMRDAVQLLVNLFDKRIEDT